MVCLQHCGLLHSCRRYPVNYILSFCRKFCKRTRNIGERMKILKKFIFVLIISLLFGFQSLIANDLFFSEYIEGTSQNKALEIYNGTGATVDLVNYRIAQSSNGNGWQYWHEFPAGSTITPGDVWVMTTDAADAQLQGVADEILSYPSVVHFNGNDARGLEKTTDGGVIWTLIDVIGNPDDENYWDVAGTPSATEDYTLVRKPSVTEGSLDWTTSAGTTVEDSQWIVYPIDTFEYLGSHSSGDTDPYIVGASATSSTNVNITFNEQISLDTAQNTSNYIIATLTISDAVLQAEGKTVALTTSGQTPGENYTIEVNNIQDLAGNTIEPGSTVNFTGYEEGPSEGQLIFSEYIEGSSNNKALEVYNTSSQTVFLDNYRIVSSYNGSGWSGELYNFPTGATLGVGDVWVIANESAAQTILSVADEILAYNAGGYIVSFTGNDARGIEMTTDGGSSWTLIDVIGIPDEDPGDGWNVAGTPSATNVHTLVRKSSITVGNTDWTASAGTTPEGSEWIVYQIDTFEYLGSHGEDDTTPPTLASANATASNAVQVTFDEQVDQTTAETVGNYLINDLEITDAILQSLGKTVELITTAQDAGYAYTVIVDNVEDLSENVILPNSTIGFTGYEEGPSEGQLIFSEYIEGSGNNKAIELYNASSMTVYLDNYRIAQSV
ncbi:hypothetical protein D4R71_08295, partial [bacterium]